MQRYQATAPVQEVVWKGRHIFVCLKMAAVALTQAVLQERCREAQRTLKLNLGYIPTAPKTTQSTELRICVMLRCIFH